MMDTLNHRRAVLLWAFTIRSLVFVELYQSVQRGALVQCGLSLIM